MAWLETYLTTTASKGEGSSSTVTGTTLTAGTSTRQAVTVTIADTNAKTVTQDVVEDEGAHVTFKIKIRGGLTAGSSFAPLCPV